ncbi:MAG: hypothetical protein JXR97_17325 [Planctomycetes bacterium]|nr:hypothetical protein [Planctomycetota bacterium]
MGRITLHKSEQEGPVFRFLVMCVLLVSFGFFSSFSVWLVGTEAQSQAFSCFGQNTTASFMEWKNSSLTRELPVALSLIIVPALASVTLGTHTLHRGGIMGFLVSLFNLVPFYLVGELSVMRYSHIFWCAFVVGALLSFYLGDLGSWLCRRRLIREVLEDEIDECCAGTPEAA